MTSKLAEDVIGASVVGNGPEGTVTVELEDRAGETTSHTFPARLAKVTGRELMEAADRA